MKQFKYLLILGCALTLGFTSCDDYLNVNNATDTPSNASSAVKNRLPWIQKFYTYSAGVTNFRTASTAGVYYSSNGNVNTCSTTWNFAAGLTTAPYQTFFIETGPNLSEMYETAKKEGAYHYMALANIYHALGFMEMLDLYGEIPYTNALNPAAVNPSYDNGQTIFNGIIAKLDEAIELLGKTQNTTATPLKDGDMINGGNAAKWTKFCYGLKARYLLKLSKKADMFKPDEILACLAKGPQSVDDNTVMPCYNKTNDVTDYLFQDPVMTNGNWDYVAYGTTQRISKFYYDMLTNMRGAAMEDPRFTKIVPASMSNIQLDKNGNVTDYTWLRSQPVDSHGECARLQAGGARSITAPTWAASDVTLTYDIADAEKQTAFVTAMQKIHKVSVDGRKVTVTYNKGAVYVNNTNYILAGDTAYVTLRSNSKLTGNQSRDETDLYWYFSNASMAQNVVGSTGSFQTRPVSDFELFTYHEACFIQAEVLFRKGDKAGALAAYKAGIKAHIDYMQKKLTAWQGEGYKNPDMLPMDDAKIAAYMASDAVCQNAAELTMRDIMLQKYVAMGCSIENWNDMRRFNYSAGNIGNFGVVYPGFDRSVMFTGNDKLKGTSKTDPKYWPRRWRLPATLELTYNEKNATIANKHAVDTDIWSYPVWWDCATNAEYEGYLK